jgi:hypothetical protein
MEKLAGPHTCAVNKRTKRITKHFVYAHGLVERTKFLLFNFFHDNIVITIWGRRGRSTKCNFVKKRMKNQRMKINDKVSVCGGKKWALARE